MAVPTPWVAVLPSACRNSGGQLCADGEDIYTVDDVSGNGATIVPDSTNRPKIVVQNGRKRIYFPSGIASFFTVTLPAARQFDDISHCIGFEQADVTLPTNSFNALFASTTTTAGAQMRCTPSCSSGTGTSGGKLFINDGGGRDLAKYGAGLFASGGGRIHCCNIVTIRYAAGPTVKAYVNGTNTEISVSSGTASGNLTAFYLGKHNTNATNMDGGYVDFWYIYDSALSQTDAGDAYTDARGDFPFFVNVDWDEPLFINIGDSTSFGFYSTTGSTWWRKMFLTDVATNFPDGEPQWLILGNPGAGFGTMNKNIWDHLVQPEIPVDAARIILYARGAVNAIRSEGQSAAQTYTACKALYDDFIAAFPTNGYFLTDTTGPRTTGNAAMESYDTLIRAEFPTFSRAPNIYAPDVSSDFATHAYLIDVRLNTNIGLDGDDTAGALANYVNAAPDGIAPNNVRNYYTNVDAIHHRGTNETNPGQTEFLNEVLPVVQYLVDITPPDVATATVQATGLSTVLTFTEDGVEYDSPSTLHWAIEADGEPVTLTGISFASNEVELDHDPIYEGQVVTFSFTSAAGRIHDASDNDMASLTDAPVTNLSELEEPTPPPVDGDDPSQRRNFSLSGGLFADQPVGRKRKKEPERQRSVTFRRGL